MSFDAYDSDDFWEFQFIEGLDVEVILQVFYFQEVFGIGEFRERTQVSGGQGWGIGGEGLGVWVFRRGDEMF